MNTSNYTDAELALIGREILGKYDPLSHFEQSKINEALEAVEEKRMKYHKGDIVYVFEDTGWPSPPKIEKCNIIRGFSYPIGNSLRRYYNLTTVAGRTMQDYAEDRIFASKEDLRRYYRNVLGISDFD